MIAVNWDHPLNRGRIAWWLAHPSLPHGKVWRDLCGLSGRRPNTGTLTNGPVWAGAKGRPGGFGSLTFDGTDDEVIVSAPDGSPLDVTGAGGITYGGWVRPTTSATYQLICGKVANPSARQYALYLTAGATSQVYVALSGVSVFGAAGAAVTLSTAWVVSAWNHLIATYDGNNLCTIYLNGRSVAVTACAGSMTNITTTSVYLGWADVDGAYAVQGAADDLGVWNRWLSAEQVADLFDQSRRGHPDTLSGVA